MVALGEVVVPTLAATLEKGPSPASREERRRHLEKSYGKITEYAKTHPEAKLDMTEEEYVKIYMGNYLALYQSRSATALATIGGGDARSALEKAKAANVREDVQDLLVDKLENWEQQ